MKRAEAAITVPCGRLKGRLKYKGDIERDRRFISRFDFRASVASDLEPQRHAWPWDSCYCLALRCTKATQAREGSSAQSTSYGGACISVIRCQDGISETLGSGGTYSGMMSSWSDAPLTAWTITDSTALPFLCASD